MRPWTFEANNIDLRNVNAENIFDQFVVRTPPVEEFLTCGSDDIKYFVVGPKGLGKTFLLKAKSKFYREISGYHCIPSGGGELVEKLTSIRVSFSKAELGSFKRIDTWEKTWELSLLTMLLRSFNIELLPELRKIIGEARTLLDILSAFVKSRSAIDRLYSDHVATFLRPKVAALREHGTNQIAVFIDNIDEGIEEHGFDLKNAKGALSEDVWINAQLGMMKVARDICQRNKHIKLFVSIRSEAFNNDRSATALQSKNNATILTYTKSQIKEIFEQNISITEGKNLAKPQASDTIEQFVGFSKMNHRFATDVNGNPRTENTFDFIFRHTFGRPREIVLMGNRIAEIPVKERNYDDVAVRETVNSVSDELLQQLRREIVPFFQDEVFDKFCGMVEHNIVSIEESEKIAREILEYHQFANVFSYLYSIGIVGTTQFDLHLQQLVQRFLPVGQYSLSENVPPRASKYFVIHSAVDKVLKSRHGPHFYDRNNIVGNGLIFHEPQSSSVGANSGVLHTHFGLGRDSLTLIIPELNKSKSIAIIQAPSREDLELAHSQFAEIRTGKYDAIRLKVVNDGMTANQINELIEEWANGGNILIYSSNPKIVGQVLNQSETVTLWSGNFVGSPHEEDLLPQLALNEIHPDTKKKVVYLCQRVINKKILTGIRGQLKSSGLDERVSVKTTLVDRLEEKTSKFLENNTLVFAVEAEEYGSIICQERGDSRNRTDQIVRRTKSQKEQEFYEDRQKYLKEGVYRLIKIIRASSEITNLDGIYDLFFDIQFARLARKHNLNRIYPGKTQSQIVAALKTWTDKHKGRFHALTKAQAFVSGKANYIKDSTRMGAFPDNKTFFQTARQSLLFIRSPIVRDLQKLLAINNLTNYYSVFICFSAKDESFAKMISDSLKKRGVDAYFFREDHRHGQIKSVEQEEIAQRDKILFIASENSITSDECQDELTLGIAKRQGGLSDPTKEQTIRDIFVPVTIDDYIWRVDERELEKRLTNDRAWKNVRMIKNQAAVDFTEFRDKEVNNEFEERVDAQIMPALLKKRNLAGSL